ncbi:recombinase family protein [Hymenobacter artigasi]|uniref:DNA invertase Pin-like site-specific DNA recombinase n=1 Tax=Hymenobacter artigasi TaxID=2719616 RepID=A0ABX1HNN9_9BACT|nr:recombinase family protein [Hymenobacter artigasi]NKI91878.1 DNA invertase Pin-like site-specific DNA recombinase [Hymenobacter artigasi]
MIAALYARVSTRDKGQTTDNQLLELRAFAGRLGFAVYREYCDQESGSTAERPQFQQLLLDAHQRRFGVVLFWSLDRFSREGVTETLNHLQRLTAAGVQFKSFTEQYLDSTGVFRDALIAILAAIAKQERVRLSERIKAGQARSAKKPGRPALAATKLAEVRRLRGEGLSFKKIQLPTGVPVGTMHRYLTTGAAGNGA